MKQFVSDSKFVLLVLVIFTAVAGFTNLDLASDRPIQSVKQSSLTLDLLKISDDNLQKVRAPASIKTDDAVFADSSLLERSFFCNHSLIEKTKQAKVDSTLLMLSFKVCKEKNKIESLHIYNQTNGFKAQIFKSQSLAYKTDYIQLNKGVNKIVLEVVLKDGQKDSESLVILTGS